MVKKRKRNGYARSFVCVRMCACVYTCSVCLREKDREREGERQLVYVRVSKRV